MFFYDDCSGFFVPLLKSLLCLQGFDNGRRYLSISVFCYLLFIFLSPVLAKAMVLMLLLLGITLPILTATSVRRIHDASVPKSFALMTPLIYCLCVFVITYIKHDATWFLLILAVLVTLAISLVNNARVRKNHQYILGYAGPIDLSVKLTQVKQHQSYHQRIEPTLVAKTIQEPSNQHSIHKDLLTDLGQANHLSDGELLQTPERSVNNELNSYSTTDAGSYYSAHSDNSFDWYQQVTDWFAINRKIKLLSLSAIVFALLLAIFITHWIINSENNQPAAEVIIDEPVKQRLNKLAMPDNFWVMHDENDAITIGWQGDISKDGELWSAKTAIGDNQCAELVFGRDGKYRSLKVIIKNQGDYYADFSPLDTQAIIKAIALKSKFNLCGFEFSLKGTQAKLMNNKKYASYFDEE